MLGVVLLHELLHATDAQAQAVVVVDEVLGLVAAEGHVAGSWELLGTGVVAITEGGFGVRLLVGVVHVLIGVVGGVVEFLLVLELDALVELILAFDVRVDLLQLVDLVAVPAPVHQQLHQPEHLLVLHVLVVQELRVLKVQLLRDLLRRGQERQLVQRYVVSSRLPVLGVDLVEQRNRRRVVLHCQLQRH